MLDDGTSIMEPICWHALFSTDAGQTFSEEPGYIFHDFKSTGKGSVEGERMSDIPADSSGQNIVKFVQNVSGKSCYSSEIL